MMELPTSGEVRMKLNKHGLPILETATRSSLKKKEKDYNLCKAKGCIYEGEKQLEGFCSQHYFDEVDDTFDIRRTKNGGCKERDR